MLAHLDPEYEIHKNRKAFLYTVAICLFLLFLFFIIRWRILPTPDPVVADLMEINLGNNADGWGENQPLIKGPRGQAREHIAVAKVTPAPKEKIIPEEDADGAVINKPVKITKTAKQPEAVPTPPKPQKPKMAYSGPTNGSGNNPNEDNGYRYQGHTPGGKGDAGDPNGHPDSYGNTPGGKIGGPKVTRGNRKIVHYYSFTGDLNKATIYAIIKVSPAGRGTFVGFDKGSTNRSQAYSDAIKNYLPNIIFDKAEEESTVTVQFNFNIN